MSRVRRHRRLIVPSLAQSGDRDRFDELCADVEAGRAILFEGRSSVLIVQVIRDRDGLSFNIWIVGGEMADARSVLPGVEALARGLGAAFISFTGGRKGWRRVMGSLGYAWTGQEFRKAL